MTRRADAAYSYTAQDRTKRPTDSAIGNIKRFASSMGGLQLSAAAAAAAVGYAITKVADQGDRIAKTSRALGLAAEEYQKYAFHAKKSGLETTQLDQALGLLQKNVYDIANGTGEAKVAFADLGISVVDARGELVDVPTLLDRIADKMSIVENYTQRTAIAQKIFGRAGKELIPFLEGGSAALADAGREAERYGAIMGGDLLQDSEDYKDATLRLTESLKGLRNEAIGPLLGPLASAADFLADVMSALRGGVPSQTAIGVAASDIAELQRGWGSMPEDLKTLLVQGFLTPREALEIAAEERAARGRPQMATGAVAAGMEPLGPAVEFLRGETRGGIEAQRQRTEYARRIEVSGLRTRRAALVGVGPIPGGGFTEEELELQHGYAEAVGLVNVELTHREKVLLGLQEYMGELINQGFEAEASQAVFAGAVNTLSFAFDDVIDRAMKAQGVVGILGSVTKVQFADVGRRALRQFGAEMSTIIAKMLVLRGLMSIFGGGGGFLGRTLARQLGVSPESESTSTQNQAFREMVNSPMYERAMRDVKRYGGARA